MTKRLTAAVLMQYQYAGMHTCKQVCRYACMVGNTHPRNANAQISPRTE